MSVLTLSNLTKRYPGAHDPAVKHVNLDMRSGEILCLVGESGSGKTTLLRLIAGFDHPSAGSIRLKNEVISDAHSFTPPEKRAVGMVFQDFALFPHFSVTRNIRYGLHALPRSEQKDRIAHMLAITGLQGLDDRYPHELSAGQQQRVALARALAPNPTILLLDEPFAALNDSLREQVREELAAIIRATGISALLVTHDIKDAFAVADRVAILKDGELLQTGDPESLYAHPCNGYVAHFFGKTNLLSAQVVDGGLQTPIGFIAATNGHETGDLVTLSIRPEHIDLVPASDSAIADCARGRVSRTKFAGQFKEVVLCMDSSTRPTCHLTVFLPADSPVTENDHIHVRPRLDKVKILERQD